MKLLLKLFLVTAGIFLAVNSLTPSQAARNHAATAWPSADKPLSTEAVYKQKCSKCHGADGARETSLGRIFGTPDFTDPGWWVKHPNTGELLGIITRGKKNMPAFAKKLTKAQIASLAGYVQRFKQ
ncbi:MAG TPA: cytochrome c [Pyrinomonadaceae bacterium]|nr:cytochrome c [Pyrinomonadaceae bacterium]